MQDVAGNDVRELYAWAGKRLWKRVTKPIQNAAKVYPLPVVSDTEDGANTHFLAVLSGETGLVYVLVLKRNA